jgi:AsmA protein
VDTNRSNAKFSGNWQELLHKKWVKITGAIVGVVILVLIILPLFVNADTFRPTIEQKISAALGRPVTLGHLSFSLLSGSLVADNVSIADDPAFSSAPFFQARTLHIGVSTAALLFTRQLHISSLTAEAPQIHLIQKPDGIWNYASLGGSSNAVQSPQTSSSPTTSSQPSSSQTSSTPGSASSMSIGELKIKNGSVAVSRIPANAKPFVYDHVNVMVKDLSFTTPMPFGLTADLPASGTVKLNGTAGPIGQPNAMNTPLHATIEVRHFDPVAAGVVAPADGISTVADLNAQINSDGKTMTTTGKLTAANLKLSASGSPAAQPVDADLSMNGNVAARSGQITDLAIHTGNVAAHINGTYQMTGDTVTLDLHLSAPGLPVDDLEHLLPAVGIRLPSGSSLHGGTLTAKLDITGSPAALRIAGPAEIDNTHLAGFSLASNIEGMAGSMVSKTAGPKTGDATDIRKFTANIVSTPQSTELNQIDCDVPLVGTATGNGTVAPSGALNFQFKAKLNSSGGVGGALTSAMASAGGVAGNLLHGVASNGVPISVTGTTANPSIRVKMGSVLKQSSNSGNNSGSSKSGILGAAQGLMHH